MHRYTTQLQGKSASRYAVKTVSNGESTAEFRYFIGLLGFRSCFKMDTKVVIFSILSREQFRRRHLVLPIPARPRCLVIHRPEPT